MDKSLKDKKIIASKLEATVRMGKSGVTVALVEEIKAQIKNKGMVKVKLLGTRREETKQIAAELAERCNAELVDVRGNTVSLFKKDG
ncbi:MAG: YhbY family RNA-binding protein [Candidatus Thermoplasmatota archaeon]|nr:YhbY family RNA-binding protein [Euryarchaeota archaeon]MBU4032399.1 YhbY family RNA-binding protein [Candidatus Thermoplasmatota archaeon]MBU4071728.1 YhbY family RNA-binding protein [Candidatus Thermoplasmatota archaeon]MBU4144824.1 YhbY family RNA-binding protein [Candidatus Thermoplasmatota archaeon]MBU4591813.1 YhbY family RNA-binding protein [Candidatus Thermoplasmatota archaeon]